MGDCWIGNYLEGSVGTVIAVRFMYLPQWAEENVWNVSENIWYGTEIRTGHFRNSSQKRHRVSRFFLLILLSKSEYRIPICEYVELSPVPVGFVRCNLHKWDASNTTFTRSNGIYIVPHATVSITTHSRDTSSVLVPVKKGLPWTGRAKVELSRQGSELNRYTLLLQPVV
jgi:hypothetical protein